MFADGEWKCVWFGVRVYLQLGGGRFRAGFDSNYFTTSFSGTLTHYVTDFT